MTHYLYSIAGGFIGGIPCWGLEQQGCRRQPVKLFQGGECHQGGKEDFLGKWSLEGGSPPSLRCLFRGRKVRGRIQVSGEACGTYFVTSPCSRNARIPGLCRGCLLRVVRYDPVLPAPCAPPSPTAPPPLPVASIYQLQGPEGIR